MANSVDTGDVGVITEWPHRSAPPTGWLICDGAALSRVTYAALFARLNPVLGNVSYANSATFTLDAHGLQMYDAVWFAAAPTGFTSNTIYYVRSATANTFTLASSTALTADIATSATGSTEIRASHYGIGDGSATFNVPDFRGRFGVSPDPVGSVIPNTFRALGRNDREMNAANGFERHFLLTAEQGIPSHNHNAGSGNLSGGTTAGASATSGGASADHGHNWSGNLDHTGGHNHNLAYSNVAVTSGNANMAMPHGGFPASFGSSNFSDNHSHYYGGGNTNWNDGHGHGTITVPAQTVPSLTVPALRIVAEAGTNASNSHNNMPPYLTVRHIIQAVING